MKTVIRRDLSAQTVGIVITLIILAVVLTLLRSEAGRLFDKIRTTPVSEQVVVGLRMALVSLGGATIGATAIGVTLTTFFFSQNLPRLHFRTSTTLYRDMRIIVFAAATISLALGDYFLATIVTHRNVYSVAFIGSILGISFGLVIVSFYKSIIGLLDLQVVIRQISSNYKLSESSLREKFDKFISTLKDRVEQVDTTEVFEIGHREEPTILNHVEEYKTLTDRYVEELTQIALTLVKQGDYTAAAFGCDEIANLCANAIAYVDFMFVQFEQTVKIKWSTRGHFSEVFTRLLQLGRLSAINADVSLHKIVLSMYCKIAQSVAPGAVLAGHNVHISPGNVVDAVEPLYAIREIALTASRHEFYQSPVTCLYEMSNIPQAWRANRELFISCFADVTRDIVRGVLDDKYADRAAEMATMSVPSLTRLLVECNPIYGVREEMFKIVEHIINRVYARHPIGKSELSSVNLNSVIGDKIISPRGGETIFSVVRESCLSSNLVKPVLYRDKIKQLICLIGTYLDWSA